MTISYRRSIGSRGSAFWLWHHSSEASRYPARTNGSRCLPSQRKHPVLLLAEQSRPETAFHIPAQKRNFDLIHRTRFRIFTDPRRLQNERSALKLLMMNHSLNGFIADPSGSNRRMTVFTAPRGFLLSFTCTTVNRSSPISLSNCSSTPSRSFTIS